MVTLLYAVSPIGLGHASRAAAVGAILSERGLKPEYATGGRAVEFLRSYGFTVHDIVTEPTPSEKNGAMRYPGLWYIRYWSGYRATKSRMSSLMEKLQPTLVAGDEEFSSVSLAVERGIKNVMISDELELGFAQGAVSRYIEGKVARWYTALQESVSTILVPDFGTDHRNVRFVSPVVRKTTADRSAVLECLGIGPESKVILLSASGSGIGDFLLRSTLSALEDIRNPDVKLIVTGLGRTGARAGAVYLGLYRDNQNIVAAADLVISTAGKSTIDEAKSFGTPMIAIPIKNHVEQERNAAALGFSHDDLNRLKELIPQLIGKRANPRNYTGADSIAAYLRELS